MFQKIVQEKNRKNLWIFLTWTLDINKTGVKMSLKNKKGPDFSGPSIISSQDKIRNGKS